MTDIWTPAEVVKRARQNGLTVKQLCERADVAHSTFSRWQANKTSPTLDVYRRLVDAAATPLVDPAQASAA